MLFAERLKIVQLFLGLFALTARLGEGHFSGIVIAAGNSTLLEQIFASVENLLLSVEGSFISRRIQLRFLNLFGQTCPRCCGVTSFGLLKFALALLGSTSEILIL